jgi:hypothetical protein
VDELRHLCARRDSLIDEIGRLESRNEKPEEVHNLRLQLSEVISAIADYGRRPKA